MQYLQQSIELKDLINVYNLPDVLGLTYVRKYSLEVLVW